MCGQGVMSSWVHHPMPSGGAGGGTGRSWYSFHMSGFAGSEPTRDRLCRPPGELEQAKSLTSDTGELNF